jgi:membrane protein required for colicin V production
MPSYLDLGVIAVVFVSAFLAMVRGFTREVLAIASWAAAALAAYAFHPILLPYVKPYIAKDQLALAASAGIIFFVTLVLVSLITVKVSDMILDSKIGALDRSLGFLFGAGRGYLLCAIAFVFFAWLVPEKSYPAWVQNSKTRGWLEATGTSLQAMLPENLDTSLSKMLKKGKDGSGDEPPTEDTDKTLAPTPTRPGQRTQTEAPPRQPVAQAAGSGLSIDSILSRDNASPKR